MYLAPIISFWISDADPSFIGDAPCPSARVTVAEQDVEVRNQADFFLDSLADGRVVRVFSVNVDPRGRHKYRKIPKAIF